MEKGLHSQAFRVERPDKVELVAEAFGVQPRPTPATGGTG